jgi:hypothetical protein
MLSQVGGYLGGIVSGISPGGWVLIALGLLLLGAGLVCLRWARRGVESLLFEGVEPGRGAGGGGGGAVRAWLGGASVVTRQAMSVGLLLLGYHGVAWGLPATVPMLRWPAEWWWVLVGLVVAVVTVSRWVDGRERAGGPEA